MNTGPDLSPPAKREVGKFSFQFKKNRKNQNAGTERGGRRFCLRARSFLVCGDNDGHRNLTKTVDPGYPVLIERRVNNAVMSRGMIKAAPINNHTDVRKVAEEHQRAKFVLLSGSGCTEATPQRACTAALKINA